MTGSDLTAAQEKAVLLRLELLSARLACIRRRWTRSSSVRRPTWWSLQAREPLVESLDLVGHLVQPLDDCLVRHRRRPFSSRFRPVAHVCARPCQDATNPADRSSATHAKVKIAAPVQPVPPPPVVLPGGIEVTPVEFTDLAVTPYVDSSGCKGDRSPHRCRARLAWSIHAGAMTEPQGLRQTSERAA
jgi:hypothetical protein